MKSGREQFIDWMQRRFPNSERRARDTAAHFDWDETFISKLVSGDRTPGLANAVKIEQVTGIPAASWLASELDESDPPVAVSGRKRR